MFSGLTNQVTSWIGKKQDGEVPKPEENPSEDVSVPNDTGAGDSEEVKKDASSPTKSGGGRGLEVLGNIGQLGGSVKSQMSSWLGGGLPGLGRHKEQAASPPAPAESVPEPSPDPHPSQEKDDDASSATGGADSDAALSDASPTEENQATQLGNVSAKAVAGAKTFGSLIYSGFSKATKTVTEASAKIKKTVEDSSILGELNKEQEAFIKEKQAKSGGAAVPPWVGRPNEQALKAECISLSTDRRNFVRAPPAGVDFPFDFDQIYPIAMATLAEDPNLEKMRFDLVPKMINEENFWRNYFYRVSLICQANEVSSMAQEGGSLDRTSSADDSKAAAVGVVAAGGDVVPAPSHPDLSPAHEFVSDSFTASSADIEEVRRGMKQLGIAPPTQEDEWEKELEAELNNYEMVNNDPTDKNLEVQLDNMLDLSDIDDLK